jgi:hypothetical protein
VLLAIAQISTASTRAPSGVFGSISVDLKTVLPYVESGLWLFTLVSLVSIPRRPQVFHNSQAVDRKRGASLISLLSFSWASQVQQKALRQPLSLFDLPCVGHDLRSRTLDARYQQRKGIGPFWTKLLRVFSGSLIHQWIIALLKTLASFSIQVSVHRLLQQLEGDRTSAWTWVAALAFSLVAEMSISCWLSSFAEVSLEIPTIAQIILLVFQKSLRRKISHSSQGNSDVMKPEVPISEINILRAEM